MSERPEDEIENAAASASSEDVVDPEEVVESSAAAEVGPAEEAPDTGGGSAERDEEVEPATPEQVAETAGDFLRGLLEAMELEAEVAVSTEGESAFLDVSGEGLGVLIGRRGQTLDALQEVTRTAVQRRLRSRARLLVDVEGYRARRRSSLEDYAREIAERAKERGTEIELEPMTAYERKVVHDAVAEVDGATSFSEGEEPNRKVVVRGE